MRQVKSELLKIWSRPVILIYLAGLVFANLFLLSTGISTAAAGIPTAAYKALYQDLQTIPLEEQQAFLEKKLEVVQALQSINYMYQMGRTRFSATDKAILAEYGDVYRNREYSLYCNDFAHEYQFLKGILAEISDTAHYTDYLEQVQQNSIEITSYSVFAKSKDPYLMLSNQKIAEAYKHLDIEKIDIQYYPEKGLVTALNFPFSDLILFFTMLVLASVLIRQERDNGLLLLIRSTAAGRRDSAFAKMVALGLSLAPIIFIVYGGNLFFCNLTFGLGDLNRSIQSIPTLRGCILPISIGQYLSAFLLVKWIGAVVLGVVVMLCMLLPTHVLGGCALSIAVVGSAAVIREAVSATGHLNVLKYANLASLIRTNELLGTYRVLYWFGKPISLTIVVITAGCLFLFVFSALFIVTMEYAKLLPRIAKSGSSIWKGRPTGIWKIESRKLFFMNGAVVVLTLFLLYQGYQIITARSYVTAEGQIYAEYMDTLSGPYTHETYEMLQEYHKEFKPILLLQQLRQNNVLTEDEYNLQVSVYSNLLYKQTVFNKITSKNIFYIQEHPGAWLLDETPYKTLLVGRLERDSLDFLICSLITIFSFSGFMAMEYKNNMYKVLQATPLGRSHTIHTKYKIMLLIQIIVGLISTLPYFYEVIRDYDIHALFAPVYSVDSFLGCPPFLPLLAVVLWFPLMRVLACIALGVIVLCLSQKIKNTLFTMFVSSVVLVLPTLLAISGVDGLEWIGGYPLFHATAMLSNGGEAALSLIYIFLAALTIWAGRFYLLDSWDVQ